MASATATGSPSSGATARAVWRTSAVMVAAEGAAAADVADHEGPAVAGQREDVVEVAADVQPLAGGPVVGGELGAGQLGHVGEQQSGLEVVGQPGPVVVLAGVARDRGGAVGEFLGERDPAPVQRAVRRW